MIYNLDYPYIKRPYYPMINDYRDYQSIWGSQGWTSDYYIDDPSYNNYCKLEINNIDYGETVYSPSGNSKYVMYIRYDSEHSYPYTLTFNGGEIAVFTHSSGSQSRDIYGVLYRIDKDYETCSYGRNYSINISDSSSGREWTDSRGRKILDVTLSQTFDIGTINYVSVTAQRGSSKYYAFRLMFPDTVATYRVTIDNGSNSEQHAGGMICNMYDTSSTYVPANSKNGAYVQRLS